MATYSAGTASVSITPDFRNFVKSLRRELEGVDAELGVDIHPDTTDFVRRLQDKLSTIDASVDVDVDVFEPSLTAMAEKIRRYFDGFSVTLGVDADTGAAATRLAELRAANGTHTMDVDADTTGAAAQLAALRAANMSHTMNVNADTTGAAAQIAGLRGGLGVVGGSVAVAGLPMLASSLAAVGNDMKALTQNAALLPGIFAGAAVGMFTMSVGLDGLKDALSDSPAKAAKAYAALGTEGRGLIDVARSYGDEWDTVKGKVQSAMLGGLTAPLRDAIGNQLPVLEKGMTGLAGVMNKGMGTALSELGNEKSTAALGSIFGNTSTAAGELNAAVLPIISSIRTLATTGSTFLPKLAGSFADAATKFDGFLTKANNNGDLARWMQEGITAGGNLLSVLGNLGSSLSSLLRAGKTDGEGFLGTVDRITEGWSVFLKSAEGQSRISAFFAEGREQLDRWQPILGSIGTLLKSAYDAATAWGAFMTPVFQTIAGLLQGHSGLLTTVLTGWLAFRTVSLIMGGVQAAVALTTTRIVAMQTAMAASTATSAMSTGLVGLGALMGPAGFFGIALAGAALGLGLLAQRHQEAANAASEQKRRLQELKGTLDEQSGSITEQTRKAVVENLQNGGSVENGRNVLDRAKTFGIDEKSFLDAGLTDKAGRDRINAQLSKTILEDGSVGGSWWGNAKNQTGLTDSEIAQALAGVPEALKKYNEQAGPADITLAELKARLGDVAESAATLGGELNNTNGQLGQARQQWEQQNAALNGTFDVTEETRAKFAELGAAVADVPNAKTILLDSTTDEEMAKLRELGYTVERMPDGIVKVTLDDAAAKAAIVQLTAPATKPVTVAFSQSIPSSVIANSKDLNYTGEPKADGGSILGGIAGKDSVPILGMPGEHMLTTSDVDKLGGQGGVYRFRAALQAGLVKPMANGGAVYPQAELPGKASSKSLQITDAEDDVDQANAKRNKVYNDPASTEADKLNADRAYQKAQNAREALNETDKTSTEDGLPTEYTAQGIGAAAGSAIATGLLSFFGLENSILSSSNTYNKAANTASDYYSGKASSSGTTADESSTGTYSYTPKDVPLEEDSPKSEKSSSTGKDHTYAADGGVEQWRPTFAGVLTALAMPSSVWLNPGLAQMRTESGGNPKAQNNSDSNAAKGTPSKGLMQVIDPTFATHRSSLFANDIWDPSANIAASVLYTQSRYGGPAGIWGQGRGYANGGWVTGGVPGRDSVSIMAMPKEFVVSAAAAQANAPLLEAINAGQVPSLPTGFGAANQETGSRSNTYDRSVNYWGDQHIMNPDELFRQQDRHVEMQSLGPLSSFS